MYTQMSTNPALQVFHIIGSGRRYNNQIECTRCSTRQWFPPTSDYIRLVRSQLTTTPLTKTHKDNFYTALPDNNSSTATATTTTPNPTS